MSDSSSNHVTPPSDVSLCNRQTPADKTWPESQVYYRQLFHAMDDGFCVCEMLVDEDGTPYDYRFLEVNGAFENHSGLGNAAGKTVRELVPNLERYWIDEYAKVALRREQVRFEQFSGDLERWFEVYAFPLGPTDSHCFATQFKDISERKRIEEALQKTKEATDRQQQQLQNLFEQAPVAIAVYRGPQHVVELVNTAMCELWGRSAHEVLNRPLIEALPEVESQEINALQDSVFRTGEPYVGREIPIEINRAGRLHQGYYNFICQPLRDESGNVTGLMVVATETTEQVAARRRVEAGEKRFRHLLNGIPQMTWTNLPDGLVNFYSERWYNYTGLTYEQLKDWGWKPIVHSEDLDDMLATYLRALDTGEAFMHENRLLRHDGVYRWHLNRSVPVRDDKGQIELWVGTSTDIHEHKLAEKELQRITRQLAATNRELAAANEEIRASNEELASSNQKLSYINADMDNFIYTASHDLKAPISNIQGLLQVLKQNLSPDSRAASGTQRALAMIEQSIVRFTKTIADLSEITKLQKQANQPIELVNLAEVVAEVRMDIAVSIEQSEAQLEVDIAECGPIQFPPKNLRSVVYNLLSNAVKYRDPDRPPVIRIRCQTVDDYQVLTVSDNGLGMDLKRDKKLFGMFQRLHDHVEGTGVGLYIVKKVVENAGGKIEVESQVGQGTTFRVYFKR